MKSAFAYDPNPAPVSGHAEPPRCLTARGEDWRSAERCVRLKIEHLPALRLAAILKPRSASLPHADGTGPSMREASPDDRRFPRRWADHKTPEAGSRYSCRRAPGRGKPHKPVLVPAASSGAAPLAPRSRRSAARVLTDEGWVKFNAGGRRGDKRCRGLSCARSGHKCRQVIPCSSRHHKFGHRPSSRRCSSQRARPSRVAATSRWSLLSFPRWHSA